MQTLPPGVAESVVRGVPGESVWKHLGCQPDGCSSKSAFRSSCRCFRDLAYHLTTSLGGIRLGGFDVSGLDVGEDESSWPADAQQLQQQDIKSLINKLINLEGITELHISKGGLPQLAKLLRDGCFAKIKDLEIISLSVDSTPFPPGLLPLSMPLLRTFTLQAESEDPSNLLLGLHGCSSLQSLDITWSDGFESSPSHYPATPQPSPAFFAVLASCQQLRSLRLSTCTLPADAELAMLTQLTSFIGDDITNIDAVLAVLALSGLRCLELVNCHTAGPATVVHPLTTLTRLVLNTALPGNISHLWQDLQGMSHLEELVLGFKLCSARVLWTSPATCHHQNLKHLNLHLKEATVLLPRGVGSPFIMPALQTLEVADTKSSKIRVEALHFLLHAAPTLQKMVMSAWIDYAATAQAHDTAAAFSWLCEVVQRMVANKCQTEQTSNCPEPITHLDMQISIWAARDAATGPLPSLLPAEELLVVLQPLANVAALGIRLRLCQVTRQHVLALSRLPNLQQLELMPAVPNQQHIGVLGMQAVHKLRHVSCLKLAVPEQPVSVLSLEGMKLRELHLEYVSSLMLAPREHTQHGHALFPFLEHLSIRVQGTHAVPLQDLHYLLHAAPVLKELHTGDDCKILVSSCGEVFSHAELVQQLVEVAQRISDVHLLSIIALRLVFSDSIANQDMTAMFRALEPLKVAFLDLRFHAELTQEASMALAATQPELSFLELRGCQLLHGAALTPLTAIPELLMLMLDDIRGPPELPLYVIAFQAAAYTAETEVDVLNCPWWTDAHQATLVQVRQGRKDAQASV